MGHTMWCPNLEVVQGCAANCIISNRDTESQEIEVVGQSWQS